jgi:putative membrane protein
MTPFPHAALAAKCEALIAQNAPDHTRRCVGKLCGDECRMPARPIVLTSAGTGVASAAHMIKTRLLAILSSILLATLLGCGGDQPAKSPDNASTNSANNGVPAGAPEVGIALDASAVPADGPIPLSDAQILQVVHTANLGEIEQAKLAQSKAKDAGVKKLAAMMLKDHTDADGKAIALAKGESLDLAPSSTNTSLESDAGSATSTLKSQSGVDFDKGYVDTQVKEHQAVLDMIDQKLIPNAKSAGVKAFLAKVRPTIAMHLQHAKDLQTMMQK